MKKLCLLLLTVSFSITVLQAQIATTKIHISAVCETCKSTIEKDLSFECGVKSAVLDVASKDLTVTYDSTKTTAQKIKLRISKIGYDADEVKRNPKAFKRLPDCCKQAECTHH